MGSYRIAIGQHLTSYRFYHELLPQLHDYAQKREATPIQFDFTETKSISPLVIPNMLCLGYIIRSNYDYIPTIHVPDNSASDNLRAYLHDIDFVGLAKNFGLFQFTDAIDYGSARQVMDPLCATLEFNPKPDGENDESVVWNRVQQYFGEFFNKYLSDFRNTQENTQVSKPGKFKIKNLLENLCAQMIYNSFIHGNSFAFMTAQINFTLNKIYLSIADCGIGFKASVNHQIEHDLDPFDNRKDKMQDELGAIANAIFARADEPYGIYTPIKRVLDCGGIVRLHSVDTRLILTGSMSTLLEIASYGRSDIAQVRKSFLGLLRDPNGGFLRRNVETKIKFGGAHIEVEIPFMREGL